MKKCKHVLAVVVLGLTLIPAYGQLGARRGDGMATRHGPQMGGALAKVFGANSAFTATMEMQSDENASGGAVVGEMSCDGGKSRFEMNLGEGSATPAKDAAQMKAMGMDKITTISRPDKKVSYQLYPGMQAYMETAMQDSDATKPESAFTVETTELGKETVDGHACVKNKVVVTDDQGKKTESTVWNATDMRNFPVKVETTQQGHKMTMLFKDVKFAKPDATQFEPPSDHKKYGSMMEMMREGMMKRMGNGLTLPSRDK